jgi:hypothetical protein
MTWALYGDHGNLDPTARLILIVLAEHAGADDAVAWPSRTRIAKVAGVSVDTVDRRLTELAAAGLIREATADEVPAAWAAWRPDRRPKAYRITGPQFAAPYTATGPQSVAARTNEPGRTNARAREAAPSGAPAGPRADTLGTVPSRVCADCHVLHLGDQTCKDSAHRRTRAPEAAAVGLAAVRAAIRQAKSA